MKTYTTQGTCSRAIEYEVTDGVLTACRFIGGCPGNTAGVAKLEYALLVQVSSNLARHGSGSHGPAACCFLSPEPAQSR